MKQYVIPAFLYFLLIAYSSTAAADLAAVAKAHQQYADCVYAETKRKDATEAGALGACARSLKELAASLTPTEADQFLDQALEQSKAAASHLINKK